MIWIYLLNFARVVSRSSLCSESIVLDSTKYTSIRFVSFIILTSLVALARSIPFTPHAAHSLLTFGSPTIGAFDHTVESSSSPSRYRPYFVICFPHPRPSSYRLLASSFLLLPTDYMYVVMRCDV